MAKPHVLHYQSNRNMPVRSTMVQLLTPYTDPESHYGQTDKQTDRRMMPIADHSV